MMLPLVDATFSFKITNSKHHSKLKFDDARMLSSEALKCGEESGHHFLVCFHRSLHTRFLTWMFRKKMRLLQGLLR